VIPVDLALHAWKETKRERCVHPDEIMGHDLLPQIHLTLDDDQQRLVMCEEREVIPEIPRLLELERPIVAAVFIADVFTRTAQDEQSARETKRGELAQAFDAGDPHVTEALVLHSVGADPETTIIQHYRYGDDGLPVWGEVTRSSPDVTTAGAVPYLLHRMMEESRS